MGLVSDAREVESSGFCVFAVMFAVVIVRWCGVFERWLPQDSIVWKLWLWW